ncbi:MAG: succinate dehydrogenase [Terriglobales bacterium]
MATLVTRPGEATARRIPAGIAPLRAGQGCSFVLRRLHSLSGIFPIAFFLLEHFVSNAIGVNGPKAYNKQVELLTTLPFVVGLEVVFIYIPLLYHSLYGFYIWYRGESNVGNYTFVGNWFYTIQRWSGAIAFFYMAYHTYTMRFSGPHIIGNPQIAFAKVQHELVGNPLLIAFYAIGIVCASWHLGAGIWLFCAKWGITTGDRARHRFAYICGAVGVVFVVMGLVALVAFVSTPLQPLTEATHALLNH